MKYLMLSLLLLTGCDQISKKDCFKSCNVLCDAKIKSQEGIDLLLGCQSGCTNIITPCARVGALNERGKNETVAYCLHIYQECRKGCLKHLREKSNGKEKETKGKNLQHLRPPRASHQGRQNI
jgi:hypothetical protein